MTPDRLRQLTARVALTACLAVGVAACGDDDDTASDDTASDTASDTGGEDAPGDACAAIVDFNAAVMDSDTEGATDEELMALGEELAPMWAPVAEGAPDEVSDQAADLAAVLEELAAGDPERFDSDETFETYTEVLSATVADCGFTEVQAVATDYAFDGLPDTVEAGTAALVFENQSESEMHEMILFKKADGETRSAEELLNDPAAEEEGPGEFAGAVFAPPGQSATGLAELTPGAYVVVCFVPVGSGEMTEESEEGEGGPPHFTQGMLAEFTVE